MNNSQLREIKRFVEKLFSSDASGHDYGHMKRVAKIAKEIAEVEKVDTAICVAAAWLHDVGDHKLFRNPEEALDRMTAFLQSIQLSDREIRSIMNIITNISYSKGNTPDTCEGKVVQDADRIDAIGAIGIARTFAYGGSNGQLIYHETDKNTSIQHFYEKLLNLSVSMHTEKGKQIAKERHTFMESFLEQFYKEWGGK